MAKKLGYGGVANTNGARDFSGKAEAVVTNLTTAKVHPHAKPSKKSGGGPWVEDAGNVTIQ